MATEYQLSYTGAEIDEKLGKIDNAVLCTEQNLTDEQKAWARLNIGAAELSAEQFQLEPNFANSIDECTDISKMYVLSDGYIYAYKQSIGLLFTDHLKNAVDENGNPFNDGLGYKKGYMNSSMAISDRTAQGWNEMYSGYIPYAFTMELKISGLKANVTDLASHNQIGRIFFLAEDKTVLHTDNVNAMVAEGSATYDPTGYNGTGLFTFNLSDFANSHSWWAEQLPIQCKYIVFAWYNDCTPEEAHIAFDEDIAYGMNYKWENTGLAFVPADYEDIIVELQEASSDCNIRIVELEESSAEHDGRIEELERYKSSEDIPAYIKDEASGVIDRVIEKQGNRSFNFIAISDPHYNDVYDDGVNKTSFINAAKAISYIKSRIHIDAVATLGDNCQVAIGGDISMERAHRWMKEMNEILEITQGAGIVDFRVHGNHDRLGANWETGENAGQPSNFMPDNAIYSYFGGYNRQLDYVDVPGGWGYRDFNNYKLRVILMNTNECEGAPRLSDGIGNGFHVSTKQFNWLIDTLDLSSKEDASEWQILLLSHQRPDDGQENATNETGEQDWVKGYLLTNILHAYDSGTSFTGTRLNGDVVSCNFGGKNAAKLIGFIHGHHHDYIYSKMMLNGLQEGATTTDVMCIGTPTSQFIFEDAPRNKDNDGNTYWSEAGTATETAFCVYCIDLDNRIIHAIHYGNGIDREISY